MSSLREGLADQAFRRWGALADRHPDLGPAIELQRQLLGEVITLLERVEQIHAVSGFGDPAALAEKLRRGLPVLCGEPIDVPVALLAPSLDRFCHSLATGGAGDVARHLVDAFESGRMSRASLLNASLARNQRAIHLGATQMGVSPDLLWLVGELATAPLAHVMQQRVFARNEGASEAGIMQSALDGWDRGYCPACGSWPALAEYINGVRSLRCSFCAAAWAMRSYRCVYCGEQGAEFVTAAPDPEQPQRLLELCGQCGSYTKAIRVDVQAPFPLVSIEDLETLDLDRAAIARGYGRPPLAELGTDTTDEPPRPCQAGG